MAAKKDAASINYVHQTAILCETIKKEQNNQKIYKSYSINPFKKSKFCFKSLHKEVFPDVFPEGSVQSSGGLPFQKSAD